MSRAPSSSTVGCGSCATLQDGIAHMIPHDSVKGFSNDSDDEAAKLERELEE